MKLPLASTFAEYLRQKKHIRQYVQMPQLMKMAHVRLHQQKHTCRHHDYHDVRDDCGDKTRSRRWRIY